MNTEQVHTVMIILHGLAGAVSFLTGIMLIAFPRYASNRPLFGLYFWFLLGLSAFLAVAMLAYWGQYSGVERIIFVGLFILSLYMLYRAQQANRILQSMPAGWRQEYIEHIGFTLISLFEGLVIVGVLDLGGPGWLVAIVAVLGVVLGRWLIGLAKRGVVA